ncbi:hypothetical protein [Microbacterium terregens]|uniref:Uncharacterized protein n=1 Tax=Microbacterium terregens TaxID=69363 RepID=A0ABV5SXK7_9MICO
MSAISRETIAEHVARRMVENPPPPLTPEQKAKLRTLLRGGAS